MIIAISGAILLLSISCLYLLLAIGKPFGYLAWGGKYPDVLPKEIRIQTAVSIPAQLFAVYVLLKLGGVYGTGESTIITVFGYVFMVFFLLNSVLNLLSKSKYEKYIMTPIAIWISFAFIYVNFFI